MGIHFRLNNELLTFARLIHGSEPDPSILIFSKIGIIGTAGFHKEITLTFL